MLVLHVEIFTFKDLPLSARHARYASLSYGALCPVADPQFGSSPLHRSRLSCERAFLRPSGRSIIWKPRRSLNFAVGLKVLDLRTSTFRTLRVLMFHQDIGPGLKALG